MKKVSMLKDLWQKLLNYIQSLNLVIAKFYIFFIGENK